jgi:hypothetical protein
MRLALIVIFGLIAISATYAWSNVSSQQAQANKIDQVSKFEHTKTVRKSITPNIATQTTNQIIQVMQVTQRQLPHRLHRLSRLTGCAQDIPGAAPVLPIAPVALTVTLLLLMPPELQLAPVSAKQILLHPLTKIKESEAKKPHQIATATGLTVPPPPPGSSTPSVLMTRAVPGSSTAA